MDGRAKNDVFFLSDEKFDFDISLSPASSKGDGDEDEVFEDPVSQEEKRAPMNVVSQTEGGPSWSPLTSDQLEAVCQEAHKLADRLQSSDLYQPHSKEEATASGGNKQSIGNVGANLALESRPTAMCSPMKRQTFLVEDTPMKELPPAIQRRLMAQSTTSTRRSSSTRLATGGVLPTRLSTTTPSSTRLSTATPSSTRLSTATPSSNRLSTAASSSTRLSNARLSTSSPAAAAKPVPRTSLRGKTMLSVGAVLPSKLAAVTTTSTTASSARRSIRLQPPSKVTAPRKKSPRLSARAASSEDLLSDSASVASDVSDSSLNSSQVGRHTLALPTKAARNLSGAKALPPQSKRMTDGGRTSSSSSSVSSFNSSMSLSPARGKVSSSLKPSVSAGPAGPAGSVGKHASQAKQRRSIATAEAPPSPVVRRKLSGPARRPSEVDRVAASRSTPLKRAESTPLQATPARRVSGRTAAVQGQTLTGTTAKPKALVPPTPSREGGAAAGTAAPSLDVPKMAKRAASVDSLPLKPSAALQARARRPSALPTPVKRRASGIPSATPTTKSRRVRLSPDGGLSARKSCAGSPSPTDVRTEEPADSPAVQPFRLEEEEEEEPAAAPPPAAPPSDQPEAAKTEAADGSEPAADLIELADGEKSVDGEESADSQMQEMLLLDLPAPTLQPQEKLLIDLTNTPDLIRTVGKTCTASQLIDLSSPLIKWSPEEKRENAPLINLSP